MLSGETRGTGGKGLAKHLCSTADGQQVRIIATRNLAGEDLSSQIRELVAGAQHGRTNRPLWHVHVDPPPPFDTLDNIAHWLRLFETEFQIESQPRVGVLHRGKHGHHRLHLHLLYSLVRSDGHVVDLKNSYRRREKISVIAAYELGLPMPPIPRPRSIHRALLREGRTDVAYWVADSCPNLFGPIRIASTSPEDRHVSERTGLDPADMLAALARNWPAISPHRWRRDLESEGLVLALGTRVPVVVDAAGVAHPLLRSLRKACRASKRQSPSAAELRKFLGDINLPHVSAIRNWRSKMQKQPKIKERLMNEIAGESIVADFAGRVRFVKRGPPHRLILHDGGCVLVDPKNMRLVLSGNVGDADTLAKRLAALEPYAVERPEKRRTSSETTTIAALRPNRGTRADRFTWWVEQGQKPENRPEGIGIQVDGTWLVDQGYQIEVHDMPPSAKALDLIARYAAEHWNGGLVLDGPPGAKDWSEKDKARLWWSCRTHGVVYHGYSPPAALLEKWDAEHAGEPGSATSSLKPAVLEGTRDSSDADIRAANMLKISDIENRIDEIKSQWRYHGRDLDWIEKARTEVDRLEDLKHELRNPDGFAAESHQMMAGRRI